MSVLGRGILGSLMLCIILAVVGNDARGVTSKPKLTLFTMALPSYMGGAEPDPGILVEMVKLAAAETGYQVEQKVVPWARALKLAMTSDNAIIPGLSRIPSRERNYTWIVRQMEVESAFISLEAEINSFDEARHLPSIGVHRATSHEIELEERGFENLRSFNHIENSIKLLEMGRISAWYGDINEFSQRWQLHSSDRGKRLVIGKPVITEHLWLAGGRNITPEIVEDLTHGTRLVIDKGYRKKLLTKYFGRE